MAARSNPAGLEPVDSPVFCTTAKQIMLQWIYPGSGNVWAFAKSLITYAILSDLPTQILSARFPWRDERSYLGQRHSQQEGQKKLG